MFEIIDQQMYKINQTLSNSNSLTIQLQKLQGERRQNIISTKVIDLHKRKSNVDIREFKNVCYKQQRLTSKLIKWEQLL